MTMPIENLRRMEVARASYAVTPTTEGYTHYLKAVHEFFALLAEQGEINVVIPKDKDLPVKLIPYLEWEFAIGAPRSYGFVYDHYQGKGITWISHDQEAKMQRMSAAIDKVKRTFDALKRPSSIQEAGFPISILANVSSATLYAVLPCPPKKEIIPADARMNEARRNFTTFTDFSKIGPYILKVEELYKLLDSVKCEFGFLPADKPFSLEVYLKLAYAEYKSSFPNGSVTNQAQAITDVNMAFSEVFSINT